MALHGKDTVLCVLLLGSMVVNLALSACSSSDESTIDSQCLTSYFTATASAKCRNIDCTSQYDAMIDCVNTELVSLTRGCQTDIETYFDSAVTSATTNACTYSNMVGRCPSASTWSDPISTAGVVATTESVTTAGSATTETATTTTGNGDATTTAVVDPMTQTTHSQATTDPTENGCDSSLKASMLATCVAGTFALVVNSLLRPSFRA